MSVSRCHSRRTAWTSRPWRALPRRSASNPSGALSILSCRCTRVAGSPGAADGIVPESYSHFVDPFIALARASGATTTLKLGTGITLVPERNPLLLAKEISTLDFFSGGRFLFGIGTGWHREETAIMGGDFDHRWTQAREAILVMKELWTKTEAEYHGKYYDFPPVRSYPKPAQKPHPPVILGGHARTVLERIVEWGDGWLPNRADAGGDRGRP